MTKEEKIKEAYGEDYKFIKDFLIGNGFFDGECDELIQLRRKLYINGGIDIKIIDEVQFVRPKSLQGIENNNGWIKVESEDDLPKENEKHYWTIAENDKNIKERWFNKFFNEYKGEGKVTHYQPIKKPKPPIYQIMKKLKSMTDFVLQEEKKGLQNTDRHLRFEKILKYAKFLKQPLKLGMFVPCDDDGNVLNGIPFTLKNESNFQTLQRLSDFEKSKEKVLFESFLVLENEPLKFVTIGFNKIILTWSYKDNDFLLNNGRTIERFIKSDLTLTENALKQIGL